MTLSGLKREMKNEFPKFELVPKDESSLMKVIDFLLKLITFWQMQSFMTHFTTTVGYKIYTPARWYTLPDSTKEGVLRHERVHLRQVKKYTLPLFAFLYLFFPVPCVWAYYRMKFEMEGYAETMRCHYERRGGIVLRDPAYREAILRNFTAASYFWTWPWSGRLEKWYDGVVEKLERGD